MKILIVLEDDCNGEGEQYRIWLEKNLPDDVELDYRPNCGGVGGGLFDENWEELDEPYWSQYCQG